MNVLSSIKRFLFARGKGTVLIRSDEGPTSQVQRVYVERQGLQAKLWFEKTADGYRVRHQGDAADFSVYSGAATGEAIHIHEAREALEDVGLDLNRCSWDDIVSKSIT
jgi:hypothetical protein